ncbi:hypothetical protein IJ076_00565 [Candidatus Saccharibacteria bacterium]|nr:hypothetical protein [Candidatus Saccharibacteria bacterium]
MESSKNEPSKIERVHSTNNGGKKLIVMASISVIISLALTSVSLAVYHYSGDIYLDRSRPGYLPDADEVETEEENEEGEYAFDKSGALTQEVLDEYIKNLQVELKALNDYQNPFGADALSDEHFGL